jgi:hypothetical protein
MRHLRLKEVRCFYNPAAARLARLTLLVGENSTGKSSFLALYRIIAELAQGNLNPNFNAEPFFLGAYDQIAHFRGGRGGRSRSFGLELSTTLPPNANTGGAARFGAEFVKSGSQPRVNNFIFECNQYGFELAISDPKEDTDASTFAISAWTPSHPRPSSALGGTTPAASLPVLIARTRPSFYLPLPALLSHPLIIKGEGGQKPTITNEDVARIDQLWNTALRQIGGLPFAVAPVRTKPERTYNPVDDTPKSEGSHIPMVLAKTFFSSRGKWQRLKVALDRFGAASGLFEEIQLKRLGRSDSDPFQILVKISGPPANLIDVGYGVSQVLPILVDLINSEAARTYLLQQPEVHLHPRAQAELATFFARFVAETSNSVIIETHSDYIIDRLRTEVRRKTLSPDDVSLVYFDRSGLEVQIYNIEFDEQGNLRHVPWMYRNFFLREEERLLGLDDAVASGTAG